MSSESSTAAPPAASDATPLPSPAIARCTSSPPALLGRAWWRLHASTWVVAFVFLLGFIAWNSSGLLHRDARWKRSWGDSDGRYFYGWPWTYQVREDGWDSTLREKLWVLHPKSGLIELRPLGLLADVFMWSGIVAIIAAFTEYRRRRRTKLLQVTLRELVVGVTAISGVLAYARAVYSRHADELNWLATRDVTYLAFDHGTPAMVRAMFDDHAGLYLAGDTITSLDFRYSNNKSLPKGDLHLHGIESFPELRELSISGRGITERELQYLAPLRELRILDCSFSPVTDGALEYISRLEQLEELDLAHTMVQGDGILYLASLKGLRSLRLSNTRLRTDVLGKVGALKGLKSLSLPFSQINDNSLEYIAELPCLESLNLEGNVGISDEGLADIARLRSLRAINLDGAKITDAGLVHLQGMPQLESISICHTRVSRAGIRTLVRMLPNLYVETSLPDSGD